MLEHRDHIERLINRRLDGALSEDEQLELNREIIKDPSAHRLLEEYERLGGLAAAALDRALAAAPGGQAPSVAARQTAMRSTAGSGRAWWLVPGSIAAALFALVLARPMWSSRMSQTYSPFVPQSIVPPSLLQDVRPTGPYQNVGLESGGRRRTRDIDRSIIGVVGEDGKVYWLEVDRTRTLKRSQPAVRLTNAEM